MKMNKSKIKHIMLIVLLVIVIIFIAKAVLAACVLTDAYAALNKHGIEDVGAAKILVGISVSRGGAACDGIAQEMANNYPTSTGNEERDSTGYNNWLNSQANSAKPAIEQCYAQHSGLCSQIDTETLDNPYNVKTALSNLGTQSTISKAMKGNQNTGEGGFYDSQCGNREDKLQCANELLELQGDELLSATEGPQYDDRRTAWKSSVLDAAASSLTEEEYKELLETAQDGTISVKGTLLGLAHGVYEETYADSFEETTDYEETDPEEEDAEGWTPEPEDDPKDEDDWEEDVPGGKDEPCWVNKKCEKASPPLRPYSCQDNCDPIT